MLTHLSVHNYALINNLEVDFPEGLTIITGETGAGKSIILGALGLIAGNRADINSVNDKNKKCVIESTFNVKGYNLHEFFSKNELDYFDSTIIRREISAEGKSRAFINDTPVTLNQLKELTEQLIDIHSQHQTLTINGSEFQLSVVDTYAKHQELLKEYTLKYNNYIAIDHSLTELKNKEFQAKKESDYLQFQFNELEEANLKGGEQIQIEQELETLNNSENIKLNLTKAAIGLNGGEQNVLTSINEIKSILNALSKFKPEISDINTRINAVYIELKDICEEVENIEQDIIYNPALIEQLTNRLDLIFRLEQKHQLKNVEDLILLKNELSDKLLEFNSLENEIIKLTADKAVLEKKLTTLSKQISLNRKKVIPQIEKEIADLLASLSMANAQLKIEQKTSETFNQNGSDKITFLFSANKGAELKELNKVASGGELSRLMLCLKSLMAQLISLPTIIFDEIDTGVSGDIANKVGNIMTKISSKIQVIAITHLPQIASKGNSHLLVYKEEVNNKTYSHLKKLDKTERIQEIAKMLSTGTPTAISLKNAEELLKTNHA